MGHIVLVFSHDKFSICCILNVLVFKLQKKLSHFWKNLLLDLPSLVIKSHNIRKCYYGHVLPTSACGICRKTSCPLSSI